ncbi:hypothetical protein HanPI659440_Chr17g0672011 [Helianthus annuus]|nr:hypothetical protein HanPI659440_Chr17g0672011 [Helianthus annuus]
MGSSKALTNEDLKEDEGVKLGFSMALDMRKFKSAMSEKCLLLFFEFSKVMYTLVAKYHRVSSPFTS